MMTRHISLLVPAMVVAAGFTTPACTPREAPPAPPHASPTRTATAERAAQPEPPARSSTAPLYLEISAAGTPAPGALIAITYTIRRTTARDETINVNVATPRGARLVRGLGTETIVETVERDISRTVHVQLDDVPSDDLVVTADVRGPASGVHATAQYRFGRPEPRQPELPRGAPIRTTDGVLIGKPIPLSK